MKKYKIAVFGASGKTAEAIVRLCRQETSHEVILCSASQKDKFSDMTYKLYNYKPLDIKGIKNICYSEKPHFIINAAGISDIDTCEINKDLAFKINVNLTETLVTICRVLDSHLIMFSTDNIFDGKKGPYTEEDRPEPINYFGKTKHTAENTCLAGLDKYTIIRTNWIYGSSSFGRKDFFYEIANNLINNRKIKLCTEQFCNPTYSLDIALAVLKIIEKNRTGIYNIAGTDWLSFFNIVRIYCSIFDLNEDLIVPIRYNEISGNAGRRLKKGGLMTLKAEADLNIKLTSLKSGLQALRYKSLNKSKNILSKKIIYY